MKPLAGHGQCGRPVVATFTCLRAHADHLPLCQTHLRAAMLAADTSQHAYKSRHAPYIKSGCHYVVWVSGCAHLLETEVADGR